MVRREALTPPQGERRCTLTAKTVLPIVLLNLLLATLIIGLYVRFQNSGLRGYYYFEQNGNHQLATTQLDATLWFPTDKLIWAPLWSNWDPLKTPSRSFSGRYSVQWHGYVKIPQSDRKLVRPQPGLIATVYPSGSFRGYPIAERVVGTASLEELFDAGRKPTRPFSVEWLGELCVEERGEYLFSVDSDDGAWLWLDSHPVVANGGTHAVRAAEGKATLIPGCRRLRIRYFDSGGDFAFALRWKPPGGSSASIPSSALRHTGYGDYSLELVSTLDSTEFRFAEKKRASIDAVSIVDSPAPGSYSISVSVSSGWSPGELRASWREPGGEYREIPRSAFSVIQGSGGSALATYFFEGLLIYVFGVIASLTWFKRGLTFLQLRGWIRANGYAAGFIAVSLLGALVRCFQYDRIPFLFYSYDELNNAWIGWNLLHGGPPIGWVWPGIYPHATSRYWLVEEMLLAPFHFHPPPLFPLFAGGAAWLGGARDLFEIQVHYFRVPAVFFSTATVVAVMVLGKELYGRTTSLLAGVIYATLPSAILLGRLAKEETLLALAALLAAWSFLLYQRTQSSRALFASGLLCFCSILTKQSGIFVSCALLVVCIQSRDCRAFRALLAWMLLGAAAYAFYGWWYSWNDFVIFLTHYAHYLSSVTSVQGLFLTGSLSVVPADGWLIWLWLAAAFFLLKDQNNELPAVFLLTYVLLFAVLIPGQYDAPWYRIVCYPFLCLGAGLFIKELIRSPGLVNMSIFLLTACFSTFELLLIESSNGPRSPLQLRMLTMLAVSLVLCFALPFGERYQRVKRIGALLLFAAFVIGNVVGTLNVSHAFTRPFGLEL